MSLRALMHFALAALLLLFALVAGAAEVIRFGYLELNKDARYDERKAFFRTLSRPFGPPYAGAEVALREARFVGQALGVSFELARARGADAPALVAELDRLHAEGVRYFLIDAPGKVVAEVAAATRGRALLLFNVSAPDDALRQAQCQAHLYHTLPNHGMQTDAIAQFLVFKKWRNVLLLQGPLDDDKLIGAAFENSARRLGLKIVAKKDFVLSNDPRQRELGNVGLLTAGADYDVVFVADSDGEFARSVPYDTVLPRPVVGAEGLVAEALALGLAAPRRAAAHQPLREAGQAPHGQRRLGGVDRGEVSGGGGGAHRERALRQSRRLPRRRGHHHRRLQGQPPVLPRLGPPAPPAAADRHPQRGDRARADCGFPAPDQQHGHARLRPARQSMQAVRTP